MRPTLRMAAVLLALTLLAASANQASAQVVIYRSAPVVSYYAPPVVSYYSPPVVSYYSAPVVSYYTAPAVSYYTPVVAPTTVTTYQGILPWRRYTVATYGAPAYVAPAVSYYYTPGYVIR